MKYVDLKGEVVESGAEWIYDWYGIQAVSPKMIQNALDRAMGDDVTIRINSGGGNVFAGCDIYNMLRNYKGNVTIEIHGLCASIAGVIAMAGKCKMSPVAQFMIHNVSCNANGDYRDMEHTAEILKKANKTIANAFTIKTGKTEGEIKAMMDKETWLTANECLEIGLVDEIMYSDNKIDSGMVNLLRNQANTMCNSIALSNDFVNKFKNCNPTNQPFENKGVDFFMQKKLKAQLELMKLKGSVKYE